MNPTSSTERRVPHPRDVLLTAWQLNRPLTLVGLLMVGVLAITLVGLVVDPRVITGDPAWLKPTKFAISISIYSFTLLWLLTFVRGHARLVRLVSWGTAMALGVEMVLIAGAVVFGTTSHFNVATPLNAAVWGAMGLAIALTWILNLVAVVLLLFQRLPDPAFAWSLRLGLIVSSVGMAVAFFMTAPTAEQLAAKELTIAGAHSVGVDDGGPGLPVVGWSTVGGDLRAPHFVGLHALQALPLVGFLIARLAPGWLFPGHRRALVCTAGLAYLGLVLLLTWQALRGQPVASPDAVTLGALAALVAAAGSATGAVLLHARRAA
ncbi:MAG: hypothetical protein M3499_00990 [Actinomycetota bacterium]|nr:hypothetical protein [Actinomycetota bacterium]